MFDNSDNNAEELCGRFENWMLEHWIQVLNDIAEGLGDLVFDSNSIHVTIVEEMSFVALFSSNKSMKKVWKITRYIDLFHRGIALILMQLFKPTMTT